MKAKKGRSVKITMINSKWAAAGNDPFHPDPDPPSTSPTAQDRQFNSEPEVRRTSQGAFYVGNLVLQPLVQHTHQSCSQECPYCHQTLKVILFAPLNPAKYIKDEACRLALLEHLRTEHPKPKRRP